MQLKWLAIVSKQFRSISWLVSPKLIQTKIRQNSLGISFVGRAVAAEGRTIIDRLIGAVKRSLCNIGHNSSRHCTNYGQQPNHGGRKNGQRTRLQRKWNFCV